MKSFDPLPPEVRKEELARERPRRALPVAPLAAPGKRQLPLAPTAREVDRHPRPIYAVWEITLACDLACRHCGSRAGRARPDELSTEEALDLVDQMADLGVKEVSAKETIAGLETRGCPQDVRDTGKELSCSSRLEKFPRISCEKVTRRPSTHAACAEVVRRSLGRARGRHRAHPPRGAAERVRAWRESRGSGGRPKGLR